MRRIAMIAVLLSLACVPAFGAKIKTGEELVKAMHAKYDGKWFKTLTFIQKNTQYRPDGTIQNSVWYEAMELPGKLRVDFGPLDSGNGMMFVDGKQFIFNKDKEARSREMLHLLMVLGFDVYGQPVEDTIAQLKKLNFDLSIVRKDKWQGRKVYVVGAKKGDSKSRQFWIDKEHLYFVRSLQASGPKQEGISETRFNKYERVEGGGWIAPEVVFLTNGKPTFLEEYTEIRTGMDLSADLFDPEKWAIADTSFFMKGK